MLGLAATAAATVKQYLTRQGKWVISHGGHGGAYGVGVPRLGRAPPCPPGGDRRRGPLAPGHR